jgi:hypothetical protein
MRHKSLESSVLRKAHAEFGGRLPGKGPHYGTSPGSPPYRIETGQRGIRPKELRELLTEYGVFSGVQTRPNRTSWRLQQVSD